MWLNIPTVPLLRDSTFLCSSKETLAIRKENYEKYNVINNVEALHSRSHLLSTVGAQCARSHYGRGPYGSRTDIRLSVFKVRATVFQGRVLYSI